LYSGCNVWWYEALCVFVSIPAALSFKLIGAAMNVWPLKERPEEGVCLYHQAAILCIDRANNLHISVKDNKSVGQIPSVTKA
jgi:hypothetical protein